MKHILFSQSKYAALLCMLLILYGQLQSFFNKANPNTMYIISGVLLVIFWIIAAVGNKAKAAAK